MSRIHYIVFIVNLLIILLVDNVKCRRARIHQGMKADNVFKYIVYLAREDYANIDGESKFIEGNKCTGSFVTNQHVITAAHCVVRESDDDFLPGEYWVFSGTNDLGSENITRTKVKEIYIPSYFRSDGYRLLGDIAVLKLEEPLSVDKISTLKLPKLSEDPPSGIHIRGVVAGYGLFNNLYFREIKEYDSQGVLQNKSVLDGESPRFLQYAQAEILSHKECVDIHKPEGDPITKYHLCARMVPKDRNNPYRGVCKGDSGGPLVIGDVIVGVVSHSFSEACDESYRPEIYTKVSPFVNFINNAIKENIDDSCVHTHIPKTTEQIEREAIEELESSMNQCLAI